MTAPEAPVERSMQIVVREFDETDREPLRRLYQASRNAAFTWAPTGAHRLLDFDADTDQERILVALVGQTVVGFASIWVPDSFLHNLFVHPEYLRRGVGRTLLARCAGSFEAPPTLKCLTSNVNALRFYTAQGWSKISEGYSPEGSYVLMAK